ncbi:MAG: hypothetical protein ACRCZ2_12420 [Fusobacteriaceae bacterium]
MTKQNTITPVVMTERLTFIDQAVELKALKTANNRVKVKGGDNARTSMNAYADQPMTDAFNGVIGFQTVAIDDWLALPAYEANRPWETRFKDKAHLRGMLSSPLQALGFGLVNEAGELLCRLDGNGRAGAWMAGALEKPEFIHVLTVILPSNMTQGSYFVSNLFDVLNGDNQKVSPEHKTEIAKRRLILSGEWIEFDSRFVQDVKTTAFTDIKTLLIRPLTAKPSAADYIISNKELVFLVDQLGINTGKTIQDELNCYSSTIFTMMMKTLLGTEEADNIRQKKAFMFWQQWGKEDACHISKELYAHAVTADNSGPKVKKDLRDHIEQQFNLWCEENIVPQDFKLPSFFEWSEYKKEKAAQELVEMKEKMEEEAKEREEAEKQRQQDEQELFGNTGTAEVIRTEVPVPALPQDEPEALTEVEKAKADVEECQAVANEIQAKLEGLVGEDREAVVEQLKEASQAIQVAKELLAIAVEEEEEAAK